MSQTASSEFGRFRSFFWPIHTYELRKVVPMMLILFLICFNYSILRNAKDAVIVTSSGAAVIPFIKVWALLPTAIILTLLFTYLCSKFSQERVFYIVITGFLAVYVIFAFFLYPYRDIVHPNQIADSIESVLPGSFKVVVSMFRNWSFTIFYVMSELWSTIVMSVMFWGFANDVTRLGEARRFYSVLSIASNVAAIAAGQTGVMITSHIDWFSFFPLGSDPWERCQMVITIVIVTSGILAMLIYRWMNKNVLNDPSFDDFHQTKKEFKKKKRLSIRESVSYLSNSKYLVCIAVLVVSYNLVINLVEIVWKDRLSEVYPSKTELNIYMNNLTSFIGIISLVLALFMAKIIEKLDWTGTALITPVTMFITCAGFFGFLVFEDSLGGIVVALTGTTSIVIAVFFGTTQNALSKAAKYSVFDATKEMAFIPLSHECKLNGKAAIDGVGSRLGKSGGSLIHQGLFMIFGTLQGSTPYVATIIMGVIILWTLATRSLGRQFRELTEQRREEEKAAKALLEQQSQVGPEGETQPAMS